jgi:RsiW-degrading membrane proteinase PrsW (M82 family)
MENYGLILLHFIWNTENSILLIIVVQIFKSLYIITTLIAIISHKNYKNKLTYVCKFKIILDLSKKWIPEIV